MPFPGPWFTQSPTSFDTGNILGSYAEINGMLTTFVEGSVADGPAAVPGGRGSSFADACEVTNGAVLGRELFTDPATSTTKLTASNTVEFWSTGQVEFIVRWALFRDSLALNFDGTVPPTAVGVEYEWPDGSASPFPDLDDATVLLSASVAATTTANRSASSPITHPTAMTLQLRQYTSGDENAYPTGALLATLPLLDTQPSPALLDTNVTLAGAFDVAAAMISPPFPLSDDPADWRFQLHHQEQITHVAPTAGTPSGAFAEEGWGATISALANIRVSGVAQPPRYRFVYDFRPPFAHRQRRDGTATTGPPLAHIGTAGGRPPLAWRQNTP